MKLKNSQLLGLTLMVLFGGGAIAGLVGMDRLPKSTKEIRTFNYSGMEARIMRKATIKYPKWNENYWVEIGKDKIYDGILTSDEGEKILITKYGKFTVNGEFMK